jgi:hypothetical protein
MSNRRSGTRRERGENRIDIERYRAGQVAQKEDAMTEETLGGAIIYYVNGEKEEVIFLRDDSTPEGQQATVERIQSALQSNLLVLKTTDNRLLAIPVQSILKIEINPAPPEVPGNVIENVRVVTSK